MSSDMGHIFCSGLSFRIRRVNTVIFIKSNPSEIILDPPLKWTFPSLNLNTSTVMIWLKDFWNQQKNKQIVVSMKPWKISFRHQIVLIQISHLELHCLHLFRSAGEVSGGRLVSAPDLGLWGPASNPAGGGILLIITKACLFKYTENFTTQKWKFSLQIKILIFFIFLLKT